MGHPNVQQQQPPQQYNAHVGVLAAKHIQHFWAHLFASTIVHTAGLHLAGGGGGADPPGGPWHGVGKSKCTRHTVHDMHKVHTTYAVHMTLNMFIVEIAMAGHFLHFFDGFFASAILRPARLAIQGAGGSGRRSAQGHQDGHGETFSKHVRIHWESLAQNPKAP